MIDLKNIKEDDIAIALNKLILVAVEHGSDGWGSYCVCPDKLIQAINFVLSAFGMDDDYVAKEIPENMSAMSDILISKKNVTNWFDCMYPDVYDKSLLFAKYKR